MSLPTTLLQKLCVELFFWWRETGQLSLEDVLEVLVMEKQIRSRTESLGGFCVLVSTTLWEVSGVFSDSVSHTGTHSALLPTEGFFIIMR